MALGDQLVRVQQTVGEAVANQVSFLGFGEVDDLGELFVAAVFRRGSAIYCLVRTVLIIKGLILVQVPLELVGVVDTNVVE
jgi:hypothetical protein